MPETIVPIGSLLDVKAVAKILDCSTRHVYRLADSGRMPRLMKLGALVRWSPVVIDEWIKAGCPSSKTIKNRRREHSPRILEANAA